MTNKEAARTLLYGLSRDVGKDKYLDAICTAICALMREEEAGKGKHEKSFCKEISAEQEEQKKKKYDKRITVWHDAESDPPRENNTYRIKRKYESGTHLCAYKNGKWLIDTYGNLGEFTFVVTDVVEWSEIPNAT